MTQLRFEKPHDLARLHDELLAAIPDLEAVVEGDGNELRISAEGHEAKIEAVVQAHDPALAQAAREAQAANEALLVKRLDEAIAKLEQAAADWPALTPTQKDAATRLAVRAVARLARLQLRRLDAIE